MGGGVVVTDSQSASAHAVVIGGAGLHARVAAQVAGAARGYRAHCTVVYGGRVAEARRVLALLELAAPPGAAVTVRGMGADAQEAVEHLSSILSQDASQALVGVRLSPGVGAGAALPVDRLRSVVDSKRTGSAMDAYERLCQARDEALRLLEQEMAWAESALGAEALSLLQAHADVLRDGRFLQRLHSLMCEHGPSMDAALDQMWSHVGDGEAVSGGNSSAPWAQVAADLIQRLRTVLGRQSPASTADASSPVVLVGCGVVPADLLASRWRERVRGIAVAEGGVLAHVALLARAMGVPMVSGIPLEDLACVAPGDLVEVDGDRGSFRRLGSCEQASAPEPVHCVGPVIALSTPQGSVFARDAESKPIRESAPALLANVNCVDEVTQGLRAGAEGVGLVRTEYLLPERPDLADEEAWYAICAKVVERAQGRRVIFRLADLGGAKGITSLPGQDAGDARARSVLARGARFLLENPRLLRAQMRALLRLSGWGNVRVMVPLVSDPGEWCAIAAVWQQENARFGLDAPPGGGARALGLAVETPEMVCGLKEVVPEVAFVSVGTNDLSHALLGLDREKYVVDRRALGLHPALVRALRLVVDAAHTGGVPVYVCGDLAGWLPEALVLWGLGVDGLSVAPRQLPALASALQCASLVEVRRLACNVIAASTVSGVADVLGGWQRDHPETGAILGRQY
ncbi:MAG: HPr family phosphocarrier protein [Anaerolineae bacterium]